MNIDFRSCVSDGGISNDCALKLKDGNYLVNDGVNLKTKGQLFRLNSFDFRLVDAEYLIPANTLFKYEHGEVISDCVIPQKFTYTNKKWYDKFIGGPSYANNFTDEPFIHYKLKLNEQFCCGNTTSKF